MELSGLFNPMTTTDIFSSRPELLAALQPKWTKYIPNIPTPKQLAFCLLPGEEALFGGAAAGGKSDALLMKCLQYVDVPGYAALILRKRLSDLKLPNSLLSRAHAWLAGTDARFVPSEHTYYFPTMDAYGKPGEPAKLAFGYIGDDAVQTRYQSAEFQVCCFDELTQHWEPDYLYLFSRLRRLQCGKHQSRRDADCPQCCQLSQLPRPCMRAATNPGGRGHQWVKDRFQIESTPDAAYPNGKRFLGTHKDRPFISALVSDNPHLNEEEYATNLEKLDDITRMQLRWGDWTVSFDGKFKPDWFRRYSRLGPYLHLGLNGRGHGFQLHELQRVFVTCDIAASAREGPGDTDRFKKNKSWTVFAVWGLTHDYHLLLLDLVRFRKEIPDHLVEMVSLQKMWRPDYWIMEGSGVGKGAVQIAVQRGFAVQPVYPIADKVTRAQTAQVRAEQGRIWLPQNPGPLWLRGLEAELFTWSGHPQEEDDQIDCFSMAAKHVSWEATGYEVPKADEGLHSPSPEVVIASTGPFVVDVPTRFDLGFNSPW